MAKAPTAMASTAAAPRARGSEADRTGGAECGCSYGHGHLKYLRHVCDSAIMIPEAR